MIKKIIIISILSLCLFSCSKNDPEVIKENPSNEEENESSVDNESNNCELAIEFHEEVVKTINSLRLKDLVRTSDGGYISINNSEDFSIYKLDQNFNIEWEKTYGGSDSDRAQSIIQVNDNGYIVTGYSKSSDGDFDENYGDYDIWILKLNSFGDLEWIKNYGGNDADGISGKNSVVEEENGNLTVIGYSKSDFKEYQNKGGYDILLFQVNSEGDLIFQKTFGGSENDYGRKLIKYNSKYNILVKSNSLNGSFNKEGNWVFQTDNNGNLVWSTFLGGINSGEITMDSSNNIIAANTNFYDIVLHKINPDGEILNTKTVNIFGSEKQYTVGDIISDQNDYITIVGNIANTKDADAFILNLCNSFEPVFDRTYSGDKFEFATSIFPFNNGYLISFYTYTSNNYSEYTSFLELIKEE